MERAKALRPERGPRTGAAVARRLVLALAVTALVVAGGGGAAPPTTYAQGSGNGASCQRRSLRPGDYIINGHRMRLSYKGPIRGHFVPVWQDLGPVAQPGAHGQNQGSRPNTGQQPYRQTGYSQRGNLSGTLARTEARGTVSSAPNPGGNQSSAEAAQQLADQVNQIKQMENQAFWNSLGQQVSNGLNAAGNAVGSFFGGGGGGGGSGGGPGGFLGSGVVYAAGCNSPPPPPPCLVCNPQPPAPPIYAPDLYLYPTRPTDVRVTLAGTVTTSRPAYDGGWKVRAMPDGALSTGGDHLFYEALAPAIWQSRSGWVVPAAQWPAWIRTELPALGLNARETADFARDWAADLPPAPYYLVAPQPRSLVDAAVGLRIEPAPETLYRLWLYLVPLQAPVAVAPPEVAVLHRRGFTAVEWGVVFPPGVTPPCVPEVAACP